MIKRERLPIVSLSSFLVKNRTIVNISFRYILFAMLFFVACKKSGSNPDEKTQPKAAGLVAYTVNNKTFENDLRGVYAKPSIVLQFSQPIVASSVNANVVLKNAAGNSISYTSSLTNNDSSLIISADNLQYLTKYTFTVSKNLQNKTGGILSSDFTRVFTTSLDSSRKFEKISDAALLTKVQQQTFKYFWDFAHPTSGLARERNTSGDVVTTGGSGFGIMSLIVGIERNFISRDQGLARMQKIVTFLKDKAITFHGAYPHWLNGHSGAAVPFSANDNGADLVETSFLVQGLIAAREYFKGSTAVEVALRTDINFICDRVEWNWFRQNDQQVLYWHWSPDKAWTMNHKIQGWNECFVTYVLAASSREHSVPLSVYEEGWTRNGTFKNGNTFYNYILPLGENLGGPLFFEHYSFLGINPQSLKDKYADYSLQTKNHTLINYSYCVDNPKKYYGYSDSVWGLSAGDINGGYTASSPTNDRGYIVPTAALSSFPYTPKESMAALHFYYYVLGDKLFKEYGFVDAFSLHDPWFADSFLAIDQGPIIVMIENHRTGLLWNLLSNAPEIQSGLKRLGFTANYL